MTFSEQVENAKIQKRKENIEIIRNEIEKSWVKEKILNHLKSFEGLFTYEEIKEQILSNDLVASKFCKDPSKQNISEKLAEQLLKTKKLPASGQNCIRFSNTGELISTNEIGATKSADFKVGEYYATQKYTKEDGGAQDNQRNDVIDFLTKGSIHHKVMAILDGEYWDKNIVRLKENFSNNKNVIITSIDELINND